MALRLRQIALVAPELAPAVAELEDVLGLAVGYRDPEVAVFGLENALLPIGSQMLEIVAPIRENTAGGRYLERRGGAGGYMIITQCDDDHSARKKHVRELGIRLVNEMDNSRVRHMQLHPKDTGGTFFEIDHQLAGNDPDGPWFAAGGDAWRAAVHTERVARITAAEVQGDDPERLAARWAEVAQLPVARAEGAPAIELEGAVVRFVACTDGRPEGLGGIELRATDAGAVREAARARGLDPDALVLVGTRIRLT